MARNSGKNIGKNAKEEELTPEQKAEINAQKESGVGSGMPIDDDDGLVNPNEAHTGKKSKDDDEAHTGKKGKDEDEEDSEDKKRQKEQREYDDSVEAARRQKEKEDFMRKSWKEQVHGLYKNGIITLDERKTIMNLANIENALRTDASRDLSQNKDREYYKEYLPKGFGTLLLIREIEKQQRRMAKLELRAEQLYTDIYESRQKFLNSKIKMYDKLNVPTDVEEKRNRNTLKKAGVAVGFAKLLDSVSDSIKKRNEEKIKNIPTDQVEKYENEKKENGLKNVALKIKEAFRSFGGKVKGGFVKNKVSENTDDLGVKPEDVKDTPEESKNNPEDAKDKSEETKDAEAGNNDAVNYGQDDDYPDNEAVGVAVQKMMLQINRQKKKNRNQKRLSL